MNYLPVIGFEIHVELKTNSKMFCGCPADHFGKTPNTQTCPVCLGLPGALPVPNSKAIEWCIKLGLALDCQINKVSKFDRKNYFYPDLPKGYQISQYDQPFCFGGKLILSDGKVIRITRVHMEEDTGKLQHSVLPPSPEMRRGDGGEVDETRKVTLIDFNRSGVPLVEIVTEPDFENTTQVTEFLKEIQQIVRDLDISTADMEKGSMRLEANISVRPENQKELPNFKVEVKNVNSFRFIKKSIEFEIIRQTKLLESGSIPLQETRGFSEHLGETVSQRRKEGSSDYRYFPEPDIPPFIFIDEYIKQISNSIPELTRQKRLMLIETYGIKPDIVHILCADSDMYTKFTQAVKNQPELASKIANNLVNKKPIQIVQTEQNIDIGIIQNILIANPQAIADYQSGKQSALFYLLGQVKKQLPMTDPVQIKQAIIDNLK